MTNWQNDSRQADWQKSWRSKLTEWQAYKARQANWQKPRQTGWHKLRPAGWHLKLDRQAQGWQRQADGQIDTVDRRLTDSQAVRMAEKRLWQTKDRLRNSQNSREVERIASWQTHSVSVFWREYMVCESIPKILWIMRFSNFPFPGISKTTVAPH